MLDAQQLAQLVEQEIKTAVAHQVQQAVSQTDWIKDLEQQIIGFVQDRITARFSNIGTLPDLVTTVEQKVGEMFANGFVPDLVSYVDQPRIQQAVDLGVEKFVEHTIDALSIDPAWVAKIENLIAQRMEDRVRARLRELDMNVVLSQVVMEHRDHLTQELVKNFQSRGIADQASNTQLTLMDGVVVVEGETVTQDLSVERNTTLKGNVLIKGDLGIQGRIAVDNRAWQDLSDHVGTITYDRIKNDFAQELTESMLKTVKHGINIEDVSVAGQPLVSGNALSPGIKHTNITSVGALESLQVDGHVSLWDTVTVTRGRVGINTEDPDSALSLWDEEVNVSLGKLSKNTAFVGTGRKGNLVLGTNRQNHIEIDGDGLTTIQRLRIGRNTISWSVETPGYSGTKGDLVININTTAEGVFAWICLGAFRWQALKAK